MPWFYFISFCIYFVRSLLHVLNFVVLQDGLKFLGNIYNWLIKKFLLFHPFLFVLLLFSSFFILIYTSSRKERKKKDCLLLSLGWRNLKLSAEQQKKSIKHRKRAKKNVFIITQTRYIVIRRYFIYIDFLLYCYSMLGHTKKVTFFPRCRRESLMSSIVDTPTILTPALESIRYTN